MNNNNHNRTKPHKVPPIKGEGVTILRCDKAMKAYEKLVKEGRLGEYEEYSAAIDAKQRQEEGEYEAWAAAVNNKQRQEEEVRTMPKYYKCSNSKCAQIGPKGETCEKCGITTKAVYSGNTLDKTALSNCIDRMLEEA